MPMLETRGAAAAKAFGMLAASGVNPNAYIENLFSTYLYTGNGATQTITNGIDLAGKGGLTLIKMRNTDSSYGDYPFSWFDTVRGATNALYSNGTATQSTYPTSLTAFTSSGFNLGTQIPQNGSNDIFASWTFRKQAKFFDIVTYTGTGSNTTIPHNLGSTPGCIMVKCTSSSGNWFVYHSGLPDATWALTLNSLLPEQGPSNTYWNSTAPTSSVFSVGTDSNINTSGASYVAYIFASNAGGFGSVGADNVITCGSYTCVPSSNADVYLGYEPQFLIVKNITSPANWCIIDNMRNFSLADTSLLYPNAISSEVDLGSSACNPNATGFSVNTTAPTTLYAPTATYIYIAIRRGPMKTPTDATKVFTPVAYAGQNTTLVQNLTFTPDSSWVKNRADAGYSWVQTDRLRGNEQLSSNNANAGMLGYVDLAGAQNAVTFLGSRSETNYNGGFFIDYAMGRAPGFFDEVCYTGTGTNTTQAHNLGVIPDLMIIKDRSQSAPWIVYSSALGNTQYLALNFSYAASTSAYVWNNTTPTSSVFSIGINGSVNYSGDANVAYLFATCPGVSKVGSYSGTGATQTINCGFTGGARFVLIKRTDSTGDWYVWDTARGMVAGTDPYLLLDSGSSETNANNVYTTSVGFQIVGTDAGINANGGTYIFLAIS
jgi:hypothetical protein